MKNYPKIKNIKAREILDSRGNFTVEVDLITDQGLFRASAPAGASRGKYEAPSVEVKRAVRNINKIISPRLKGKDPTKQKEIDKFLDPFKFGANATTGVSMAVCRAGATAQNLPLYKYIGNYTGATRVKLPQPAFNIINGGVHAKNDLDFQEFMIVPQAKTFQKSLQMASKIYQELRKVLGQNVGDEGGFAPPIGLAEEALDLIREAIKKAGYQNKVKYILDVAASQFYQGEKYQLQKKKMIFSREEFLNYYQTLIEKYPIIALEDPFAENDWQGWKKISNLKSQNSKLTIIGDDLLVTNPKRIKEAQKKQACNGLLLKVNQIGTVSKAIEAAKLAKSFGWKIMVSHRSGETNDDFIADLAVGIGADYIKAGAPARGERIAKYNRLLRIEEEIKKES